jgi:hypothetical protein
MAKTTERRFSPIAFSLSGTLSVLIAGSRVWADRTVLVTDQREALIVLFSDIVAAHFSLTDRILPERSDRLPTTQNDAPRSGRSLAAAKPAGNSFD